MDKCRQIVNNQIVLTLLIFRGANFTDLPREVPLGAMARRYLVNRDETERNGF